MRNSSSVEQVDDRVRKVRELVERGNNWFRGRECGFTERYIRGELHLVGRRTMGEEADCGFLVVHPHPTSSDGNKVLAEAPTRDVKSARVCSDAEQPLMLSQNIELMQGPQKIVPSLVRFQRFDSRSFGRGERLRISLPCTRQW